MESNRQHNTAPASEPLASREQTLQELEAQVQEIQALIDKKKQEESNEETLTPPNPSEKAGEPSLDRNPAGESEFLPPELQRLVNKEEADRVVYEDSWSRARPSEKFSQHSASTSTEQVRNSRG